MRQRKHLICWMVSLALAAFGLLGTCLMAAAAQPSGGWWLCPGISLGRPCLMCPDNYCCKPLPAPPCPVCCFGCNDYCCKPLPCVAPVCCFGCDDYCCKPLPIISPCYTPPGATCGPPGCGACVGTKDSSCSSTVPITAGPNVKTAP
jgi:hypothetical protein